MNPQGLKVFDQKILVVGPIYDQIDKVSNRINWISQHGIIIFNGNLTYPHDDLSQVRERIKIMDDWIQSGKVLYNVGDQDLILMKKLWDAREAPDIQAWLRGRSNVVMINFAKTQSNLIVTAGGVTPQMRLADLQDNLETSFVTRIGGRPWHELYGGGLGYIVANNPLTESQPKYYNFSLQIGNAYSPNVKIYAAHIQSLGVKEIICL